MQQKQEQLEKELDLEKKASALLKSDNSRLKETIKQKIEEAR